MLIKCGKCGKDFNRKPSRIREKVNYCSKECTIKSIEIKCDNCGRKIRREPNQMKNRFHFYCSRDCLHQAGRKGKQVLCSYCGKNIYRNKADYNKNSTGLFFCSNSCKSKYYRQNYIVNCVVCGKEFEKVPAEQKRHPVHCCSIKCRSQYNNKRVVLFCQQCGKCIKRPPSLFAGKKNLFCSKQCYDLFQDKKITVACAKCGKLITKSPVYINKSRLHFCGNECKAKFWFNGNVLESEFEKMVRPLKLNYSRNNRTILWERVGKHIFPNKTYQKELDFYFPDLEYAVEINGCSHYYPIYGDSALYAQRNRDREKKRMCKDAGIKLRSIKVTNPDPGVTSRKYKRVIREIRRLLNG